MLDGDTRSDFLAGGYVEVGQAKLWQVIKCDSCRQDSWLGHVRTTSGMCVQRNWRGCMHNTPSKQITLCFACDTERVLAMSPTCSVAKVLSSSGTGEVAQAKKGVAQAFAFSSLSSPQTTLQDHFTRHGFVIVAGILPGDCASKKAPLNDLMIAKITQFASLFFTQTAVITMTEHISRLVHADDRSARVDRCLAGIRPNGTSTLFNQVGNLKVHVQNSSTVHDGFSLVPGSHNEFFRVYSNTGLMGDQKPTHVDRRPDGRPRRNRHVMRGMCLLQLKTGDVLFVNDKVVMSRAWRPPSSVEHKPHDPRSGCSIASFPTIPNLQMVFIGLLDESVRAFLLAAARKTPWTKHTDVWGTSHSYHEGMLHCLHSSVAELVSVRSLSHPGISSTSVKKKDIVAVQADPPAIRAFR